MLREAPEIYELIVRETDYPYLGDTIHLFIGGSAAHGAKIDNRSDFDLLGVYIPPLEEIVGIRDVDSHYVWSTAGDKVRNSAEDIDMTMYSLRKWAKLATSGNPTAIEFMFVDNLAPKGKIWDTFIAPNTSAFLSSKAGLHFKGFCEHMLRTLKGEGVGKRGQRPDLIAEFGYDTKAAMHLIRVLNEGVELMQTGRITLPRPEKDFLIDIRRGKVPTLKDIEDIAMEQFGNLESTMLTSCLPPAIDLGKVSEIVTAAQETVWNQTNELAQILSKAFSSAAWWISEFSKLYPSVHTQWGDQKTVEKDFIAMAIELHNQDKKDNKKASELIKRANE